jgi:DNA-binding NarL/FixJ family response regulator
LTVLLCDDAVLYATLVTHWFKDDADIEVVGQVSTGREALELLPGLRPDVVVLDHMLPDGMSAEVAPRLRAQDPGVAIVLVSGLMEDALDEAAAAIGAEAAVSKASSRDALRLAILSSGRSSGSDGG